VPTGTGLIAVAPGADTSHMLKRSTRRARGDERTARRFGLRMLLSIAVTLGAIGAVGEVLITHQLRERQIATYARAHAADVESFRLIGVRDPKSAVRKVAEVLQAIGQRPGTLEALLIDSRSVVRASGVDARDVGQTDSDARIVEALRDGTSYAGREADPESDGRNFEFVAPLDLPGGRYAVEVSYDHRLLDADLHDIRRTLALLGLLTLFGGGAVFYVIGGRSLMRSHASSLLRATRDGLTDLPNQRAFQDELPHAVASATRFQAHLSLAVLDVDDFKFLNDRYGHPYGDAVLRRVADAMRTVRAGDRAFRVGGDEFAIMLSHTDAEGAQTFARRLCRTLAGADVAVSVGVSELRPGQSAESLRAEADAALYETKRHGGGTVTHFSDVRDVVEITTADKRDAVRRLVAEGRLTIEFQPIWDLSNETLLGVEALTRPDPSYGFSGPSEAFDVAQHTGHVHELDMLCATRALEAAAELPGDTRIFVNLAPTTLDLDAEGNDWFPQAVERAGLAPERIVIEVTERFGGRTTSVVKALGRMRDQGFALALDDVGTGNSGLEMLRRVGAEFVKLDGSIVAAAATEPNARAVLLAMATYAHQTGSFVIAEGIEDIETVDFLRHVHEQGATPGLLIQGGQGFGLGRPGPDASEPPNPFAAPVPAL
jgi:diguanylate cyclase (GGDEF)-like protein